MTQRQHILAMVAALALLGATLSTGSGYGDDHIDTSSVTILPCPLTAMLTWASFQEQPAGAAENSQHGYFMLRVLDERGYATGWNISLSTMDYSGSDGHLGADQLALSPGDVSMVRGNSNLAGHSTFTVAPLRTNPSLLLSVPNRSGDGEYDLRLTATLGVPGDQHTSFLYTLIVTIDGVAP